MLIPYGTQCTDEDDIAAVAETLRSGLLTTGPKVAEFEKALAEETGAKYAAAVSSGTAALHIAALSAGFGCGDEVITSPLTFAATANCVLYCGAKPVFADIDAETMLLDTGDVLRKITPKTKGIIPVHYGGELCDTDEYEALADKFGLKLIQDCAHSLGSVFADGKKQGQYGGQQIWSFHPVKTITSGEGGAVTTNDENIYKSLMRLRTHGITRDSSQYANESEGGWYYEMSELGFNYRITDIQCALGISQLKKLPRFGKRRAEIVGYYNNEFAELPVTVQKTPQHSEPVRHLYTIRLDDKSRRREVFDRLRSMGIGVNVHYIPVYLMPFYERLGYKHGLCPNAEDAYERLITIPLYPSLTDEQVEYVVKSVKEALM